MLGIVGIWMNQDDFNGEIDSPFQCPLTRQPTSIITDPGTLLFIQNNCIVSSELFTVPRNHNEIDAHRRVSGPQHDSRDLLSLWHRRLRRASRLGSFRSR